MPDHPIHICAEIEYEETHSDLCFPLEDADKESVRSLLHRALDEFLDDGVQDFMGFFYVGNPFGLTDKDLTIAF